MPSATDFVAILQRMTATCETYGQAASRIEAILLAAHRAQASLIGLDVLPHRQALAAVLALGLRRPERAVDIRGLLAAVPASVLWQWAGAFGPRVYDRTSVGMIAAECYRRQGLIDDWHWDPTTSPPTLQVAVFALAATVSGLVEKEEAPN